MSEMWTPGQETKIGSWTPAELRRFIVNTVLSDPANQKADELPVGVFPGAQLGVLSTLAKAWVPGMQQVADVILWSTTPTLDITGIPQSFAHLLMLWSTRGTAAQFGVNNYVHINGITSANYYYQTGAMSGASVSAGGTNAGTGAYIGDSAAASEGAGRRGVGITFIPNYSQSNLEPQWWSTSFDYEGGWNIRFGAGIMNSPTNGISSLSLFPGTGSYAASSRATVFGLGRAAQ